MVKSRRLAVIAALAAVLAAGEFAAIKAFNVVGGQALTPQVSAPPPFGVFHDLRWIMVFHHSWWTFGGALAALFIGRGLLIIVFNLSLWPRSLPRPSFKRIVGSTLLYIAIALVLLTPSATLLFTMAVAPLYQFFLVAAVVFAAVALVFHLSVPVRRRGFWPPLKTIGWVIVEGVVLTLASLAVVASPGWAAIVPVLAAGAFNAVVWRGLLDCYAARAEPAERPTWPGLRWPLGITVGLVVAAAIGFGVAFWLQPSPNLKVLAAKAHIPGRQPVMQIKGFRSHYDGRPRPPFPDIGSYWRFSYRGIGANRQPLSYSSLDTYKSLSQLSVMLNRQINVFNSQTHRPVTILSDSEGTLITKYYLLTHPHSKVNLVVMTSPIVHPGRVYYPPASNGGWGVADRFPLAREAQLISAGLFPVNINTPIVRSLPDDQPLLREGMLCATPGTRQVALLPLVNAIAEPPHLSSQIPLRVLPTFHAQIGNAFPQAVKISLSGQPVPHFKAWEVAEYVIRGSAAAWQMPSLPLTINPAWHGGRLPARCYGSS